jgi:hypothetical protein
LGVVSSQLHDALFRREGAEFVASPLTRGPWDDRFQHGGPPAALLAGAMERFDGGDIYQLARVSLELLRPVPIASLRVEVGLLKGGRSVQRLEAALTVGGQTVVTARGLRIRRAPTSAPPPAAPEPWPDPEQLEDFVFPFFRNEVAYHRAVQLRVAHGAWGTTPVGFWARPRQALIEGEAASPLENLMILADAQSGMGVPLDVERYTFPNPDLTVYFERAPTAGWFGFDIRSSANAEGFGLAQSAIRDAQGLVARSAQSLVVDAR